MVHFPNDPISAAKTFISSQKEKVKNKFTSKTEVKARETIKAPPLEGSRSTAIKGQRLKSTGQKVAAGTKEAWGGVTSAAKLGIRQLGKKMESLKKPFEELMQSSPLSEIGGQSKVFKLGSTMKLYSDVMGKDLQKDSGGTGFNKQFQFDVKRMNSKDGSIRTIFLGEDAYQFPEIKDPNPNKSWTIFMPAALTQGLSEGGQRRAAMFLTQGATTDGYVKLAEIGSTSNMLPRATTTDCKFIKKGDEIFLVREDRYVLQSHPDESKRKPEQMWVATLKINISDMHAPVILKVKQES